MNKPNTKKIINFIDENRIYIACALVWIFMLAVAPNFANNYNITTILRSASMNALVTVGFTIILIARQLDLSFGSIISLAAVLVIGIRLSIGEYMLDDYSPAIAWTISFILALAAGSFLGLLNGILVHKAKINFLIVTLGAMISIQGLIYIYTDSSLSANTESDYALADFLRNPIIPEIGLLTPRVIVTIFFILLMHFVMLRTRFGRNIHMVGGNPETAWLAGINTGFYVIIVYVLSGFFAALAGSMAAMENSFASLDFGANSLLVVIAAVIIGGTSMAGGRGSILKSAVTVLMLEALFNGLNRFKVGNEFKILLNGLIMASIILYEAYLIQKAEKLKGQQPELLKMLKGNA